MCSHLRVAGPDERLPVPTDIHPAGIEPVAAPVLGGVYDNTVNHFSKRGSLFADGGLLPPSLEMVPVSAMKSERAERFLLVFEGGDLFLQAH
jgi:hypothetical protein